MKSFKNYYLSEGLAPGGLKKAIALIVYYLRGKVSGDIFSMPEAEKYTNSEDGTGYGARFFIPKGNRSFRINWTTPNDIGLVHVHSMDVWLDDNRPYHFKVANDVSLAKTLPLLADFLNGVTQTGPIRLSPDGAELNESAKNVLSALMEGGKIADAANVFDGMMELAASAGKSFNKSLVSQRYSWTGAYIFDELKIRFPKAILKQGISFVFLGNEKDIAEMKKQKEDILNAIGATTAVVSKGSGNEKYAADSAVADMEQNIEKLSYKKQLADLEHLIKLTLSGSANALFIAGRGGIGKTHTVEKVLAAGGLQDNHGYFKNTGTASAAGIYALLFRHKDGIVLFDDSDDALGDQEARNLFKAATDTKKVRKLVWNKMGKNIVDPDGEMSDEEILDSGLLPRYFEFTGKIIFISNLPMNKLDPDGAIRTRAYLIDIDPTDKEVYDFMMEICDDIPLQEGLKLNHEGRLRVIELLRSGGGKQTANLRKLSRGLNMAAAGIDVSDADLKRMIATYA